MLLSLAASGEAQGQVTQTVLVTGSSGFVGQRLVTALVVAGYRGVAASRNPGPAGLRDGVDVVRLPNLAERIDWDPLLEEVAYVVHLAGVAHQGAAVSEEMYDRINTIPRACGMVLMSFVCRITRKGSIGIRCW